ncbi:MAG: hypothetical protein AVO38_00070 [delta proteobacterium ML8_D]|jgi:uncharacterized protein|nr:MAG: hypothetical protein AVO38_00070 [delta proteobacterium ML8_D]
MLYLRIISGLGLIIAVMVIIYVVSALYNFFMQSHYVYCPEKEILATPFDIKVYFEEIIFRSPDGVNLSGWFIPCKARKEVVLLFHGNGGNISTRLAFIKYLYRKLGLSLFIIDYRGYGKSEGKPSEEGTYLDARAAWEYLMQSRKINPEDIIIYGRSLGGSVAARLAGEVKKGVLILDSTFTSLKDIASEMYPYLPVRKFLKYDYPTIEYIRDVMCPVLIIHSSEDDYIPFSHAATLYEHANEPKKLLKISGGHNNSYIKSEQVFIEGIRNFISGKYKED